MSRKFWQDVMIVCILLFGGCAHNAQRTDASGYGQNADLEKLAFSPMRFRAFLQERRDFADAYHLDTSQITLRDSVLMTPEVKNINLFNGPHDTLTLDGAEEFMRAFLDRWGGFLNTGDCKLEIARKEKSNGGYYRIAFTKTFTRAMGFLPFSTRYDWIDTRITKDGKLVFLDDQCAPNPYVFDTEGKFIPISQALSTVAGRHWQRISGWVAGKVDVTFDAASIKRMELVDGCFGQTSPTPQGGRHLDALEYRICWKASSDQYSLYVDAVTGEYLESYSESLMHE